MKCFSHMNASECICPQRREAERERGRGVVGMARGQSWAAIESFFSSSAFDGNGFVVAVAAAGVAENVGNSWKQFFVVKGFKSRSRSRSRL